MRRLLATGLLFAVGDSASVVYSIQLRDGRTDQTTYYLVWLNGRWLIDWAV